MRIFLENIRVIDFTFSSDISGCFTITNVTTNFEINWITYINADVPKIPIRLVKTVNKTTLPSVKYFLQFGNCPAETPRLLNSIVTDLRLSLPRGIFYQIYSRINGLERGNLVDNKSGRDYTI